MSSHLLLTDTALLHRPPNGRVLAWLPAGTAVDLLLTPNTGYTWVRVAVVGVEAEGWVPTPCLGLRGQRVQQLKDTASPYAYMSNTPNGEQRSRGAIPNMRPAGTRPL